MDRRTLFIMIAASWILVVYMMFNAPQPAKKQEAGKEPKDKQAVEADQKKEGKDEATNEEEAKQNSPSDQDDSVANPGKGSEDSDQVGQKAVDTSPQKTQAKQDQSPDAKPTDPKPAEAASNDPQQSAQKSDEDKTEPSQTETKKRIPQKFISLGSLAGDSPYRFLATLDNRAASVHRLELVQRKRNGEKLQYKDLEVRYGYLGHLDLVNAEESGCLVKTCGAGTPAQLAGIQVGDRIIKFDGQPVDSRIEFEVLLRSSKPKQQVAIEYIRDGKTETASATLMRQPLEVIRPTIVPEQAAFAFEKVKMRKSFSVSLFEPTGTEWKKLGDAEEAIWESKVDDQSVKFYYPYFDEDECRNAGYDYQLVKTYRLKPVAEEDRDNTNSMNYHLDFDLAVKNLGEQSRSFAYRVDGPNGLPTEDWWFAIKIHGEWAAVFTQAGARDIVASTASKSFHFVGGPKIYTNGTKENKRQPIYVIDPGNDNPNAHQLKYIGVDSHYFVSALIPSAEDSITPREAYSAYAMPQGINFKVAGEDKGISQQRKKEANWYRKLVPVNFKTYFVFEKAEGETREERQAIGSGESLSQSFMIFAGPKEPGLLKQYGIDDTVTFGWFAAFSWPLVNLLHLFYAVIGNYAIAIVLLTILVRLAMMRFSRKMVLNSQMMQLLAPEIKAIAEKYKEDFQAKSRAQQELFRKYNYNPFSGCLVMLIQLPVFIGLYRGLSVDMALRDQALIPGVNWCSNLAGPDQMWRWADDLPSFFSFLTHETGWLGPYFNLLPIISVVLMLIQQKMFTPPPTDDQQAMMQKMMTFMMVFIGVIFFKVPAGLCIYFITSTLWAIMEKKLIPPPRLPDHLQKRLDELKELQAKEKADGVAPGTYTNVTTTAGGNATRKHTERAKKRSQKNRRK